MAGKANDRPEVVMDKKQLKAERKKLKAEQKTRRKEARARAKELDRQEEALAEDEVQGGLPVALVTLIIIAIWLAILCLLVKLDVGGIGSTVLRPILKDIPIVKEILPDPTEAQVAEEEATGGYDNVKDAVVQLRTLEQELEIAQQKNLDYEATVQELNEELKRLRSFEDSQLQFEATKNAFYEEVVYADKGPGAEAYQKYYEAMDPATAEYLYKQVVQEQQVSNAVKTYAEAYAAMKPKDAAAIFDTMTDDLQLVAKILGAMGTDDRGNILGAMDEQVAAQVTKIMEPK